MRSILLIALASLLPAVGQEDRDKPESRQRRAPTAETTITGCVDQKGDLFVLIGPHMQNETVLKGRAFSDDNFARFVGHKATVRGELKEEGQRKVLHAVRIEKAADTCH
jgi:hypothetical protein